MYKLAHRFMVHLKFTICIWLNLIEPKNAHILTATNYQSHAHGFTPQKGFYKLCPSSAKEREGEGGEKVQVKHSCSVTTDQSPT